ncbi:MAG: UvrD-helicase domain-containing protein [Crocinitomicaceae bacterium]|nr:UvrD-helicase domain-containing protein [Crocinitomicaceae bacterium]MDP5042499.1 UvrD-helicase domain-containing protein [Crocinitomicaceae bacterium]
MPQPSSKALRVYAASAGSGKTHRLVLEYLKILLSDANYRQKFRHIVAMTFTNKAANEMKDRILQTLSGLAYPASANSKTKALQKDLLDETSLTEVQLQQRAAGALQGILHHYEDFNISTIDKFNLRLIRSFSRDLDLPADFEVVLNEKLILDEVLDLLIARLGQPDAQELTRWMLSYARTKVAEGESWDFKKSLLHFSEVLSKERNAKEVAQLLTNTYTPESYKDFQDNAARIKTDFLAECVSVFALAAPFKGSHFKTPTDQKRIDAFVEDPNWGLGKKEGSFYAPKFKEKLEENFYDLPSAVNTALLELETSYDQALGAFKLVETQRKNFYDMALLQYVAQQTKALMTAQQQIRISEFNQLISQLVQGEQAPYIYERLGIRYEHFLLDEFQDTSRLQWVNMIPLVLEAISYERPNLIVGDAKQSIYRFNNGLAEQFVALPSLYNPEQDSQMAENSARFEASAEKKSLLDNYRSAAQIVEFNNALFKQLSASLPPQHQDFYASLHQNPKSTKSGFVHIESLVNDLPAELLHEKIRSTIEQVLQDGFRPCDICVLTETNKKGNAIALALTQVGMQVVSQDSLLLTANPLVQLFILYLKKRAKPANPTLGKRLAEAYLRAKGKFEVASYMAYFKTYEKEGKQLRYFDENAFYKAEFGSEEALFMPYEHLFDLLQKVAACFQINDTEEPYLHHFFDVAFQYQLNRNAELLPFIEFIAQNSDKLALQMPESTEAIRVMTIHKAKGLEFPVVLMPSLDFSIVIYGMSKFLMQAGDGLAYSFPSEGIPAFKTFKDQELAAIYLDKLNLLYVALTRPENRLYVWNHHKAKGFGAQIHEQLTSLPGLNLQEEHIYVAGEAITQVKTAAQKAKLEAENTAFYHPMALPDQLWYPSLVFRTPDIEHEPDQLFGLAFHRLMSLCSAADQLPLAIQIALQEGSIAQDQLPELRAAADRFWAHIAAQQLQDGMLEEFNEQRIIADINQIKQPDKVWLKQKEVVVIDFKTGLRKDTHMKQIISYAELLQAIFNLPVRPFLYYTELDLFLEL